ncbi:MAG: hypothetical protein ABGZ53_35725 [Fuerstiella sp.]
MSNPADGPNDSADTASRSAAAPPTKRERRLSIAFSGVAFFISYVITAGPAVFMVKRFDMPTFSAIVEMLYAPLVLIVKSNVPVIAPLIKAWVSLFQEAVSEFPPTYGSERS